MMRLRKTAAAVAITMAAALSLTACADPVDLAAVEDTGFNLSPDQNPPRSTEDPAIAEMVPENVAEDGQLTVGGLSPGTPPLIMMATDNETPIGVEVEIARLVADKLGLELDLQLTSWDNWPLKLESQEYEAVHANIGVNDERLQKFDFSTYRGAYLGFMQEAGAGQTVEDYRDIEGQRIAVVAGTNQERVLLEWNEKLEAEGREPADLYYYTNENDMTMALVAGRVDLQFNHFPGASYLASTRDDVELAGRISAGWPDTTTVAVATPRGSGLAPAYTAALNALIEEGTYQEALERWELGDEALEQSETVSLEDYGQNG